MIRQNDDGFQKGVSPLKILRKKLGGISQEELARRIGVSSNTVSRWERGLWNPTLTIPQIKALEVQLHSVNLTFQDLPDSLGPTPET
ncbi:MAG: helix-turn-helix transcriptional regulator [Leptolyngbya sp. SIO4C1]|nr:helix-turn-helix transcriptional regulator [Leptolyngbya sp. SIO4C1]